MDQNLNKIQSPEELKVLPIAQLKDLSKSIKDDIIQHTSVNGGHIGASLCCVDMIVALHKVFQTPQDCFVFDVGHQAYAHKMLTGRRFQFYKLRKENGVSGFTNRFESDHDSFGAGHASTSISAALGILEAKKLNNDPHHAVAIVGDGALTGGLTFEGLNHAGDLGRNLVVVLNDNKMSIDPNVGALKDDFEQKAKDYFGSVGVDYWGPFDGHDIVKMIDVFQMAKKHPKPVVIHLHTVKGHTYQPAEKDKIRFHGCGPFDLETGNAIKSPDAKEKYQDLFSETLTELACQDEKVVAITAAMPSGTSLKKFNKVHPDRFYDVGLAEPHAVEFGAGLATQGIKPFVCVYSTFLQRAYDQLIHDVALQNLPVRVCMDRGGLVGDDGATHQGVFDFAYLRSLPNFVVMAPKDEAELQHMMETMRTYENGPISVRFPRGQVSGVTLPSQLEPLQIGKAEVVYGENSGDILILAVGTCVQDAIDAAKKLKDEKSVLATVVNLRFVKPLDEALLKQMIPQFKAVVTVEEGVKKGGAGSAVLEFMADERLLVPVQVLGVPDQFVEHASQNRQRALCSIDCEGIYRESIAILEQPKQKSESTQESGATVTPLQLKARG